MEFKKDIIDIVFIGASPISIIEAAFNKRLGRKVLIIERKNEIGGAWGIVSLFGAKDIESGCHILDITKNNQKLFNFLQSNLGLSFSTWEPQPKRIFEDKVFGYSSKYYLLKDYNSLLHNFVAEMKEKKSLKVGYRLMKNIFSQTINILKKYFSNYYYWGKQFSYFKEGTAGFIKELHAIITSHRLDVLYDTKIENIAVGEDHIVRISAGEKLVLCKKIFLTSGSEIHSIKYDKEVFEIPVEKRIFKHLFLNIKNAGGKEISYIHDLTHDYLFRLNDVTSTVNAEWRKLHPTNRIFVVLLREGVSSDDLNNIAELIHERMKMFGFLGESSEIIDMELISQEVFHRSFNEFPKDIPNVEFLRSTNLIKSLNSNLERWKKAWDNHGT